VNQEEILTIEAKIFLNTLTKEFSERIENLLEKRKKSAKFRPGFNYETKDVRDEEWQVLPPPKEILDRRVEITGPPVRKMIINALNSGANVYMSDFEDSNSPTFQNCIDGQINLRDAVEGTIEYTNPKNGKSYSLNDKRAVLFVRPRGLHLLEKNYLVDGNPIPACLFDYGLYIFHNWKTLQKKGSRPYFYLPKLENHKEAKLWADVFKYTENHFGMQNGTIKATVLIETLPAAFQMDEILWELRMHSAGLNCGRWDYIFSFIKTLQDDRDAVLPDRNTIGMTEHFMRAYSLLLIQTCHKRGAHAIGGMAAQIPIKNNPEANETAMNKVKADKLREVVDGHDGTWVAHPGLIPLAKEIFDSHMPEPNQIDNQLYLNYSITKKDLLCVPRGQCTEEALIDNINIGFQYLNSWINGNGCVPINNLMEDAATAEISRAQIWQWKRFKVWLANGKQVSEEMLLNLIDKELEKFKDLNRFEETKKIFIELCTSEKLVDFLTPTCYDALLQQENDNK
jgi:malate synthase